MSKGGTNMGEMLRHQEEKYEAGVLQQELDIRRKELKEEEKKNQKKKKPKRIREEPKPILDPDAEYDLLRSLARNDPLGTSVAAYVHPDYDPILRHPLPLSEPRCEHEAIMRKVLSCRKELQLFGAITLKDAWVLEECYMRGAPVNIRDRNGFTPLHIAIQLCQIECIMVLMNIVEVDVNVESLSGYTPLYIAEASNCPQSIIDLLISRGALRRIINIQDPPRSILDGRLTIIEQINNLPPMWSGF